MRPVTGKTQQDTIPEWDAVASLRQHQISSGADLTYSFVLRPTVLRLAAACSRRKVLDAGCGTGFLTKELARLSNEITGIDPSERSLEYARENLKDCPNARIALNAIEDFDTPDTRGRFSLVCANMVMMTVLDLGLFLRAVSSVLEPGGSLVGTITHPCFWHLYWEYGDWFDYRRETVIEGPFAISLHPDSACVTTHVHRPLEAYIDEMLKHRLAVLEVLEPYPPDDVMARYPKPWRFPRYLAFRCRKLA